MNPQEHSTLREGLVVGVLGAVLVAAWYLIFDAADGRPLHTASALGRIFFQGDVNPGARAIDLGAVLAFTVLHLITFVLAGLGLVGLAHLASRNLSLRMGVWIGLVVAFCFLTGVIFMLSVSTNERLPLWRVIGGSALGIGGMAWMVWRRHPRLSRSFDQVPLGDEVKTPGHAPGGPRV